MEKVDRRILGICLEKAPPVMLTVRPNGAYATEITEPYVRLIQLLAQGYYNSEIIERSTEIAKYIKRLKDEGEDFSDFDNWGLGIVPRRILTAFDNGARTLEEISEACGLDIDGSAYGKHFLAIRKAGIKRDFPQIHILHKKR